MAGLGPKPLVLCGPSGSGKSTLLRRLLVDFPDAFGFSVSHTTRKPRHGEENGVHYHFTSFDNMQTAISAGKFIESATFSGNLYGTSKAAVEIVRKQGKVCVLDIDVQGVKKVKQTDLNPWYVFVKPPSLDALEQRLRARNSETEESLKTRLQVATEEIKYGDVPENFDIVIINDNLEHAYSQLKAFVSAKVLRREVNGQHHENQEYNLNRKDIIFNSNGCFSLRK